MKKILSCLVLAFSLTGFLACHKQKPTKIPGAYKALEMFSYIRSYPYNEIPSGAYTEGFTQHQELKKKSQSILKNNETEWEAMGPFNTAGRALTVAVNPLDPQTLYLGSASGGLWRSRELGQNNSWEYMPTGFPVLGVSSIAFAPNDSMTMYIGTGEVYNFYSTGTDAAFRSTRGSYGIGILKSEDGGASWSKSLDWSYQQNHGVWMIKVSEMNANLVYAATTQGVYKTIDAGQTWERILDNIMVTDIEVDPRDDQKLIVSCGNFGTPDRGIFRTEDGGLNWTKVPDSEWNTFQGKILLARSQMNPDVLYASVGNGFGFNDGATWLLKSENNGVRWSIVNTQDYSQWQGWFSHDISIHPEDDNEIIAVGIDIYKSTDGGETLEAKSYGGVSLGTPGLDGPDGPPEYSHSDHHFVMHHPELHDVVLFGNDGGLFLSFDGGETFGSANIGLQTTQFYNGFSVAHSDLPLAMGGLQDNSTVIYRGTGAWQRVIGGDGSWSAINQRNTQQVFGSYQNLNILRSPDNGFTFFNSGIQFGSGESPLFISPYVISDSDDPIMYAGGKYIYRSDDISNSWQIMNNGMPLNGDPVFCMDVFDDNPDIVYAATVGSLLPPQIFKSVDGGETWTTGFGVPPRIPNDIAIHPVDPDIAYVCLSGFGTDHLYKTEDGGESWYSVATDLPDVPTNAIAIDPENPDIMYLGNDIAVYYSENAGVNWSVFGEKLPDAVIAMDLTINPVSRKLWIATHGNGAYRADMLPSVISSTDQVDLVTLDYQIFPNPVGQILNIKMEQTQDISWTILNAKGQLLKKGKEMSIDMHDLSAGNYFIKMTGPKHKYKTQSFVKI